METRHTIDAVTSNANLIIRDLGRMRYAEAYALQKDAQAAVIAAREVTPGAMQLLLVEHDPPVITVSRRPGAGNHLLATQAQLRASGVEVEQTDRGGDITYHGPGQLVVYPILDLNQLNLRLTSYLRFLEQALIDLLAEFGIQGERDASATGVWVRQGSQSGQASSTPCPGTSGTAKIAAIGVRVSRWVSMHGLALNVTTNLDHFDLIVPCGLAGRSVTSMQRELGEKCPSVGQVKSAMIGQFQKALSFTP